MSQRDYYEILGVAPQRERTGHQERVPQAGAEIPSRSQSRRQRRRRTLQGSRRGVRGARRLRQARALRPLRPRGRRGRGRGPAARLQPRHLRGLLRHPRRLLRIRRSAADAAAARRAAPTCASISKSRSRSRTAAPRRRFRFRATRQCETCKGSGRGAGHVARNLSAVPRHRPAALPAGLPRRRADVRPVRRRGPDRHDTVPDVPRHRPRHQRSPRDRADSAPASPTASACASTARASTAPRGGPTGDLYVVIHVRAARRVPPRRRRPLRRSPRAVPHHGDRRIVQGRGPGRPARGRRLGRNGRAARSSASAARACRASRAAAAARSTCALVVDVPKKLTKEQKKLVEELRKSMPVEKLEPRKADDARRRQAVFREGQRPLRVSRFFPALDVSWARRRTTTRSDRLLATIDDDHPIAVEDARRRRPHLFSLERRSRARGHPRGRAPRRRHLHAGRRARRALGRTEPGGARAG